LQRSALNTFYKARQLSLFNALFRKFLNAFFLRPSKKFSIDLLKSFYLISYPLLHAVEKGQRFCARPGLWFFHICNSTLLNIISAANG
jgi:hypothetical protein